MDKKIILVTGSSDGVGKETAKALAKQGHTIILHGRDKQKLQAVYNEIQSETGNSNIDMFVADFLSLAEVKRLADTIGQKYERLDVLINNAGAQFRDFRETTAEGLEKTMTINVFAPFLLTTLLLDLLKKSKSARVVTVTSAAHSMSGKPDFSDIQLEKNYTMGKAYGQSKLYVIWVMQHFAKEMEKAGINNVTFNSVHPASAFTNLGREAEKSLKWKIIYFLWRPMMKTAAQGAASSIYAAVSPELESVTGKYYGLKGEEKPSAKYWTPENEQTVWDYCKKITKPYCE
ncbi:MAG: SDR family NAD(P)-dependent oxidoreductase [Bacteroidales bacterium]|jgi:NAD(P)-dependent dehydrogenase (short-subunit alcohol dehydrogenase family)|nr:SDR family NAD(P)-dependent oxidoreductase [Bacteroidales bacterium]